MKKLNESITQLRIVSVWLEHLRDAKDLKDAQDKLSETIKMLEELHKNMSTRAKALTDEQIAEVKRRRLNGEKVMDLAVEYHVHYRTIEGYCKGLRKGAKKNERS